MSALIKFFELDKYRLVTLDREWISTIKEFKKILTRDKGSKGDIDGRKKLQAIREFTFIYHFCDYASKFGNYPEDDKEKECAINADLPQDFDYTKDEDLVIAIAKYKKLQETPAIKMLNEAREGLHLSHKVIRKIRLHLESELAKIDLSTIVNEEETADQDDKNKKDKKKVDPITKITTALEGLISLTNKIEPAITNVDNLIEKVKKELGDTTGLRGKREKGFQEEPTARSVDREVVQNEEEQPESTGTAGMFANL